MKSFGVGGGDPKLRLAKTEALGATSSLLLNLLLILPTKCLKQMNRGPKELKLGMQDKLFMMKMLVRSESSDVASEAVYRDRLKSVLQVARILQARGVEAEVISNSWNKIHQTYCHDFSRSL